MYRTVILCHFTFCLMVIFSLSLFLCALLCSLACLWFDIIITVFYMRASTDRPTDQPIVHTPPMNIHFHMRCGFCLLSRTGIAPSLTWSFAHSLVCSLYLSLYHILSRSFSSKHCSKTLLLNTYVRFDVYTSELLSCTVSLAVCCCCCLFISHLSFSLLFLKVLSCFAVSCLISFPLFCEMCSASPIEESVLCQIVL